MTRSIRVGLRRGWSALLGVTCLAAACGDPSSGPCADLDALLAARPEPSSGDWLSELEAILAEAPADSAASPIVYVPVRNRAGFEGWMAEYGLTFWEPAVVDPDAPATDASPMAPGRVYAFRGFSAYWVMLYVEDLPAMRDLHDLASGVEFARGWSAEAAACGG